MLRGALTEREEIQGEETQREEIQLAGWVPGEPNVPPTWDAPETCGADGAGELPTGADEGGAGAAGGWALGVGPFTTGTVATGGTLFVADSSTEAGGCVSASFFTGSVLTGSVLTGSA